MDFKTFLNNTISRISHAATQRAKPSAAYNEQRTKRERIVADMREDKGLNRAQRRAKYSTSKRGRPYRRVLRWVREQKFAHGTNQLGEPMLVPYFVHKVYHATKGVRTYRYMVPAVNPGWMEKMG